MGVPFKYKLILPSGAVFVFEQPQWDIDFHFPDGFGLPPITHQTQEIYQQPGAALKGIKISPRIIPLTVQLKSGKSDRSIIHEIRKTLWKALRWNTTTASAPPDPLILRYENNNVAADLRCYFLSDNFSDEADSEMVQNVSIQLIAYDPFWYRVQGAASAAALTETAEKLSANLSTFQNITTAYIAGKVGGLWSNLAGGANGTVFAIAVAPDGSVYASGNFTTIGGVAANRIAKWNGTAWSALGTGLDNIGEAIAIAPNGDVIVVGDFTAAGGVANTAHVARWDGAAWNALGTGTNGVAYAVAIAANGDVYVAGDFLLAGGVANTVRIAKWNGSAWSPLGTGLNGSCTSLAIAADGSLYAAGAFTTANAVTVNYIAKWNGTTFSALAGGAGASILTIIISKDGSIYATGNFTTIGGISAARIAKWNGTVWSPLGTGLNLSGAGMGITSDGILFVGGQFTTAGGLAIADRVAQWNGSNWAPLDIDLPGSPTVYAVASSGLNIYLGFDTTGTATASGSVTTISMRGDFNSYPIFTITGQGTLQWIENTNNKQKIVFNLFINTGETVTIDLSPGVKTITSNSRGNLLPYSSVLPISDFGVWALSPDPITSSGSNTVVLLMTGTTPVEVNDDNNQLSGYTGITGLTPSNTAAGGILYVTIVSEGAGNYHVNLYSDSARTALVGHTASYNSNGAKAIVADNSSGLGGTITVDARTAADSDIYVYFATAKIVYKEPFLSADAAVLV